MNKVHFYRPVTNKFISHEMKNINNIPASNLYKDETGYSIEIAVPGFLKSEIDIQLKDSKLKIIGNAGISENPEEKFVHKGFGKKSFEMSYNLSETIDQQNINAKVENGVLTISLAFKEEVKEAPKSITIN